MLYKIHHTGTNCFPLYEVYLGRKNSTPKRRMHESLFHELCQSYHTLHKKKFINLTPKGPRLIVITLLQRQIPTNVFIVWHLLLGGLYVCCKIDTLGL